MPVLENPRHERFCQELVKGATADQAYVAAGFAQNRGNACSLKAKQHIQKRVAEIQTLAAARVVQKAAVIDKSYVLQQAHRMFEASANAAIPVGEDGSFDPKAANVAARFLDQLGNHVDVQAFSKQTDVSVRITVDSALSKLAALEEPIEGEYTAIDGASDPHHAD